MTRNIIISLVVSLPLTVILETVFLLAAGKRGRRDLLLLVLANVVTNPAVVLIYSVAAAYTGLHRAVIITPLEITAVFIEGYYYKKYGADFRRPYLFSVAANAFSYGAGFLIQFIAGLMLC